MCLIGMAIDQSRQFPLVIAANRDEYFARPAARLGWWTPEGGGPAILGGRDLQQGGTWLGLTAAGRLAMVTNVRDPKCADPQAPIKLWPARAGDALLIHPKTIHSRTACQHSGQSDRTEWQWQTRLHLQTRPVRKR
jgi:hypothetical protein